MLVWNIPFPKAMPHRWQNCLMYNNTVSFFFCNTTRCKCLAYIYVYLARGCCNIITHINLRKHLPPSGIARASRYMLHHIMANSSWRDIAKLFPRARSPLESRRFEDSVITINRNDDNSRRICPRKLALGPRLVPFDVGSDAYFFRDRETMDSLYRPGLICTRQVRVHALHTLARRQITHFLRVYNYDYTLRAESLSRHARTNSKCTPNCYRDILIYTSYCLLRVELQSSKVVETSCETCHVFLKLVS